MPQQRIPTMDRYLRKVDKSQGADKCWPWTGGKDPDGYGIFWDGTYSANGRGHYVRVTRWTYEQFIGPLPAELQILHSCDNPPCVNPSHLSAGTSANNHAERESRGRGRRCHGSTHVGAKLTEAQVVAIRETVGVTNVALAEQYGVSNQLISMVRTRKIWTHI
jgi:hypothetical protein